MPESQDFCKVVVHMQIATRICMKGQGVDFIESPRIWAMSTRNFRNETAQMVQKTSLVLPRKRDLGSTAGNRPSTVNFLTP